MADETYDIIIIGTGAGGGTLTHTLAPTGQRILVLERGPYLPREKANWEPRETFMNERYHTHEQWVDKEGKPFRPGTHYFVGGNTKVYGAALLRLRERDFGEVEHAGGLSPAWPISYADLQPYYLAAEQLYSVHGERGCDPLEPPETAPYPHPPVSHEARVGEIADHLQQSGLHPFHLPLGIRLNEQAPEVSECIRCDTCDGFPCLVHAKADAHTTCIAPALEQYPNVTLLTEAKAVRLLTDSSGRKMTEVEVEHNGSTQRYQADLFVTSCGAINSAALLLRSANDHHPNGLGNSSDMVGRHYMCHNNSAIVAISTRPNPTTFPKTLGINDFYYGSDDWQHPLGHMQLLGAVKKEMLEGDAPMLTPGLALEQMAEHAVGWWITSEDLPDPDNRVTLTQKGDIALHYTANNEEAHHRLLAKLKEVLKVTACDQHILHSSVYLSKKIPIAGVAHQVGTCRFGTDPKSSVLDINCRAHDLDNLYLVDGSFFCCSAAVNPALTIIANALRVGDHLKQQL